MKNYLVTHTFKSEEARKAHFDAAQGMTEEQFRAAMKNDVASFQMNWSNQDLMVTYCWWKANSPEDILSTLGEMADLYENNIQEMPFVVNITD